MHLKKSGVVVQLVRIPACHAGGRGFESRPYRRGERRMSNSKHFVSLLILFYISSPIHFLKKTPLSLDFLNF